MTAEIPSKDISEALNYTDDQLFELIGVAESPDAKIRTDDVRKLIGYGRAWWSKKESDLKPAICGNSAVQRLAGGSILDIAQAVYSAVFPELGVELAIYASALIVRSGISNWCDPVWRNR
jgi:hypothetical protein